MDDERIEQRLRALAAAGAPSALDATERAVWARIAADGAATPLSWQAGIVAVSLLIGAAVGGDGAARAKGVNDVFGSDLQLAPSTLLAGAR